MNILSYFKTYRIFGLYNSRSRSCSWDLGSCDIFIHAEPHDSLLILSCRSKLLPRIRMGYNPDELWLYLPQTMINLLMSQLSILAEIHRLSERPIIVGSTTLMIDRYFPKIYLYAHIIYIYTNIYINICIYIYCACICIHIYTYV